MEEFPAIKVHIQPAILLASLGVVIGQNSALQWREGGGGRGGGSIENWVWPKGKIHTFSEGGEKKVSDK